MADFAWLQNCFAGPLLAEPWRTCLVLDADENSIVEVADYLAFLAAMTE